MKSQPKKTQSGGRSLDRRAAAFVHHPRVWVRTYRALTPTRGLQREWGDGGLLLCIYASYSLELAHEQQKLLESLEELDELRTEELRSFHQRHRSLSMGLAWARDSADAFAPLSKRCPVVFAPAAPSSRVG